MEKVITIKNKIQQSLSRHKILTIITIVALAGGGYYINSAKSNTVPTRYVLGKVTKGDIITSIAGSGQVSSDNQVDIKPKVTGDVLAVKVKENQKVKAGDVLMQLNDKDLKIQLSQAANSLTSAKANLDLKLIGPTKEDIAISKNSIDSAKASYESSKTALENAKLTSEMNLKKAELQLSNSQVSLENAKVQYQNSLSSQTVSTTSNSQALNNAYDNAKTTISSSLVTLRNSLVFADSILGIDHLPTFPDKSMLSITNQEALNNAQIDYPIAKNALNDLENKYNEVSTNWDKAQEEALLSQTAATLQKMKALEHDIYNILINTITSSNLSQASLDGYRQSASSQENGLVSNINSIQSTIQSINAAKNNYSSSNISSDNSASSAKAAYDTAVNNYASVEASLKQTQFDNKKSIDAATADVNMKKISLENSQYQYDLKVAKPRAEELASLRAQVSNAENSYELAKENLNDARITSPIDGQVAKIDLKVGDEASPSTAAVTVITSQQIAEVSLNEVDAAKVKADQKVTLTFNAIDNLSITGVVANVDTIGTVTQGVVNYNVKIVFDTQDERVKSGMSASASIITDQKFNVALVEGSAIKSDGDLSYVEVLENVDSSSINQAYSTGVTSVTAPVKKYVQIGLADGTNTEITQGLEEGNQIIIKTIISTSATASSNGGQSGLKLLGGSTGGGNMRAMGR